MTFRVLEKYYVGELIDNELPVFPKQRYTFINLVCLCPNNNIIQCTVNFIKC